MHVNSVFPESPLVVVSVIVELDEVAYFSFFENFQGMLGSILAIGGRESTDFVRNDPIEVTSIVQRVISFIGVKVESSKCEPAQFSYTPIEASKAIQNR
jgi:predicted amidohydrolase